MCPRNPRSLWHRTVPHLPARSLTAAPRSKELEFLSQEDESMSVTVPQADEGPRSGGLRLAALRRGATAQMFAVVGAVFLVFELFSVIPWLLDGPHQVTQYRDHSDISWVAARVYEIVALIVGVGLGTW